MEEEKLYRDIREIVLNLEVPRNKDLIEMTLKEKLGLQDYEINTETLKGVKVYLIRYENILVQVWVDSFNRCFMIDNHFDVIVNEEVVESH